MRGDKVMAMSRKDYDYLATVMGLELRFLEGERYDGAAHLVRELTDALAAIGPRFDRAKFMEYVTDVRDGKRNAQGERVA